MRDAPDRNTFDNEAPSSDRSKSSSLSLAEVLALEAT